MRRVDNFYSHDELEALGIAKMGRNLKISRKTSLYSCDKMEFGDNVRVDDFCVLSGRLVFGNNIHITAFCLLAGADEGIYFDDFATLAYRCCVFTRSDDYGGDTMANSTIPERYRYNTLKESVYIKKHAIVGANSVIFPGAHIEEGVAVGAASLVAKPTQPWGIYFGAPAKRVKDRSKKLLEQEKAFLSEG